MYCLASITLRVKIELAAQTGKRERIRIKRDIKYALRMTTRKQRLQGSNNTGPER